ncbi:ABC transporter ATP-binding protein [Methylobacterium sp. A54F]
MRPPPAPDPAPRLVLDALRCRLGGVQALDGVSLTVAAGEIVGLLGDSGCGKSTLLRIVAGLERADSGEVRLDGASLLNRPPEARGVGLMFQDYALFPHLTVAKNVRFGLAGRPRAQAADLARARLAEVGLGHRAGSYPATLSGGEAQRVALARALAPGPRILLLDEPFSNLDRRTRDRVRADTVAVLREAGTTTLLVTHDPEEALGTCDRIALMRAGRIVQAGTGADLYDRPASPFAARFFGATLDIAGQCLDGRLDTPLGMFPARGFEDNVRLCACLRRDALRPGPPGRGVPGRVLARAFLGDRAELTVAVPGLPEPATLAVPPQDGPVPGDAIGLELTGRGAFIFAAEAD